MREPAGCDTLIRDQEQPALAGMFDAWGQPLENQYTVFVVSGLIVAGWLAVFALLMAGRDGP